MDRYSIMSPLVLIAFLFFFSRRIYFGEVQLSGLGEGMVRQYTETRAELFSVLVSYVLTFLSATNRRKPEVYAIFVCGAVKS